jgi:hypothetical protein
MSYEEEDACMSYEKKDLIKVCGCKMCCAHFF